MQAALKVTKRRCSKWRVKLAPAKTTVLLFTIRSRMENFVIRMSNVSYVVLVLEDNCLLHIKLIQFNPLIPQKSGSVCVIEVRPDIDDYTKPMLEFYVEKEDTLAEATESIV